MMPFAGLDGYEMRTVVGIVHHFGFYNIFANLGTPSANAVTQTGTPSLPHLPTSSPQRKLIQACMELLHHQNQRPGFHQHPNIEPG
jgi:hypothetical protein